MEDKVIEVYFSLMQFFMFRYYALEVTYFKSSLDRKLLELLWNKYWVNTLSSSSLLTVSASVRPQCSARSVATSLFANSSFTIYMAISLDAQHFCMMFIFRHGPKGVYVHVLLVFLVSIFSEYFYRIQVEK